MYLVAAIPDMESWRINVEYNIRLDEINKLDKIELSQTDKDIAVLKQKPLSIVHAEKLAAEKKMKIQELNKKFGITPKMEDMGIEKKIKDIHNNPKELWNILQGKGLVKGGL